MLIQLCLHTSIRKWMNLISGSIQTFHVLWILLLIGHINGNLGASSVDPQGLSNLRTIQKHLQLNLKASREATVGVGYGGSGVIISSDGYVLTAAHVTGRAGRTVRLTLYDGRRVKAKSLGVSEFSDSGLLKITEEGAWPFAPMADADSSSAGDWCYALGHAGGLDATRGPVLRLGRVIKKQRNMIRTDCLLIGGDSGGPLFHLDGHVIGINSRVSEDIDDNYHAPIESFHRHWKFLVDGKTIPERNGRGGGFLGVQTVSSNKGLVIERVYDGTPAAEAMFKVGDVITHVDGYSIELPNELGIAISSKKPEDQVVIRFRRNSDENSVEVELGERPDDN